MTKIVERASVLPLYGQVSIHSPATDDFPEFMSGDEYFVASSTALVIATHSDIDGPVTMTVVEGLEDVAGEIIFDAEILFEGGVLEYGNIPASDLHVISLSQAGATPVKVYVDSAGAADKVTIVLGPGSTK